MLGSLYGVSGLFEIHSRFSRTGDASVFAEFERKPYRGVQAVDFDDYRALFDAAYEHLVAVKRGTTSPSEASGQIFELLRQSGLCPAPWNLLDPQNRCPGTFTILPMMNLVRWGRFQSPTAVRRHYFLAGRASGLITDMLNRRQHIYEII